MSESHEGGPGGGPGTNRGEWRLACALLNQRKRSILHRVGTRFTKLNEGWNAEPNAPEPRVMVVGSDVQLEFLLNEQEFPKLARFKGGRLIFKNATKYRMGRVNDEGSYRGQCRFSKRAPAWGEFYEVDGDLLLNALPDDWHEAGGDVGGHKRHFLFYFRDEEFECEAEDCEVRFIGEG